MMRLDKFLSQQLAISRADAARVLRAKRVKINNECVRNGAFHLTEDDRITCDDVPLFLLKGHRYYMLYKPSGYLCSHEDSDHPTVFSLIDVPAKNQLHLAGRLDLDTTGLVLITDDGQWSHRLTSPKHHTEKTYLVTLALPPDEASLEKITLGVQLHGEKTLTMPAKVEKINENQVRLTICEGRYHQVKRMFAAVGNKVIALHRERIGEILLDDTLKEKHYRPLTEQEIASHRL